MGESIDGKGSGDLLKAQESLFGMQYYFSHQYSWDSKSILLGRTTCGIFLKDKKIDYTGISTDGIEKKQNFIILLLTKMENYHGPKVMELMEERMNVILFLF